MEFAGGGWARGKICVSPPAFSVVEIKAKTGKPPRCFLKAQAGANSVVSATLLMLSARDQPRVTTAFQREGKTVLDNSEQEGKEEPPGWAGLWASNQRKGTREE